jgi:hypothetical protein
VWLKEMGNPFAAALQSGFPTGLLENRIPFKERDLMSATR